MTILELFRSGMDTNQITEKLGGIQRGWTEARVYNLLSKERNEEKDAKPVPTSVRVPAYVPTARLKLIRYAGYEEEGR